MIGADLGNGVAIPAAHVTAIEALLAVPAVNRVGLGLKFDAAKRALPQWAYRVYLEPKTVFDADLATKAAVRDALVAAVPAMQGGHAVDVFFDFELKLFTSRPELRPGAKLAVFSPGLESETAEDYGSLGLVVTRGGTRYILTAAHVVGDGFKPLARDLYIDDRKKSLCTQPIAARSELPGTGADGVFLAVDTFRNGPTRGDGTDQTFPKAPPPPPPVTAATFGVQVSVDAALVPIDAAMTNVSNLLDGVPSTITTRDLAPMVMDATPAVVSVWKQGARTKRTRGVVVELMSAKRFKGEALATWELQIDAVGEPGDPNVDDTFGGIDDAMDLGLADTFPLLMRNRNFTAVVDTATPRTLKWTGNAFGRPGDSGAAVFDDAGKVIGLLINGETTPLWSYRGEVTGWGAGVLKLSVGTTGACFIKQVFLRLGLNDASIVPATAPSAAPAVRRVAFEPRLQVLVQELVRSPLGTELYRAAEHHADEIARLVHHHRRVTVAYHRGKAAAYAALLIDSLRDFSTELPLAIDGRSGRDACRSLFIALRSEASSGLQADLDRHSQLVFSIVDGAGSISTLLQRIAASRCEAVA